MNQFTKYKVYYIYLLILNENKIEIIKKNIEIRFKISATFTKLKDCC